MKQGPRAVPTGVVKSLPQVVISVVPAIESSMIKLAYSIGDIQMRKRLGIC